MIMSFDSISIIDSRWLTVQLLQLINGQIYKMSDHAHAFWQQEDDKQVIATPFWMQQSKM